MKVIIDSITYSGGDIGSDLNFKFVTNNFSGENTEKKWTPIHDLKPQETQYPKLEIFLHHENIDKLSIDIEVKEIDFMYDDFGNKNSTIPLNIKNGVTKQYITVDVMEGSTKATFGFWVSIKEVRSLFFQKLWKNHPGRTHPCDSSVFNNQCAIRMGVALEKSGVDTSSFDTMYPERRCWLGHNPGHILAAQELANWIKSKTHIFGTLKKITPNNYPSNSGIIFIKDGWGTTDHIDVWNGSSLKGGDSSYLSKGTEVWFWDI